ncbi:MAG: MarR family winged helix-turn-helix transcriptional regulator [Oligoflexales bacterium]
MTIKSSALRDETKIIIDSIRRIVQALRTASKKSEKDLGVSAAQLFILQKISEDPGLSINDLADLSLTHQSSVSVVVAKLLRRKLVEKFRSKIDARAVQLRITDAGRKMLDGGPQLIQDRLLQGITRLTLAERTGLIVGLRGLIEKSGLPSDAPSLFFEEAKKQI